MSAAARRVSHGIFVLLAGIALALVFASAAGAATFNARGSVEQVYVTDLPAGAGISLLDSGDSVVATRNANSRGGALFRNVDPGSGYRVRLDSTSETSDPLTVLTTQSAPPSTDVYNQSIPNDGYGYMTMRDGTKLAYSVHPPTDVTNVGGVDLPPNPAGDSLPSPTLIEYSGYGYARPEGPVSGIAALANIMGFTVVDVNMRGTGCSGGAFDFFEPLQNLDGYDVIETVSRQPWVAHNKVGMLGISYGGISQLFTAQTRPPSLAAITPVSLIDQVQTTLYPGGMLNTGFAYAWAQERMAQARPADPADPNNGAQPYAVQRIAEGDTTCQDNQDLHPEAADLEQKIRDNDHYVPEVADPLSPAHVRRQDQRPGLHGLPVDRRADRRPLPDALEAPDRDRQEVDHVDERHARGLAQSRDLQPPLRLPPHLRRAAGAAAGPNGLHQRRRAGRLPGDLRNRRARRVAAAHDAAAGPDPGDADL